MSEYALVQFNDHMGLSATLADGRTTGLVDPAEFVGYREQEGQISNIVLRNNGLHIDILIDRDHPVAKLHPGRGSAMCTSNQPSPRSWTAKTPSRRSMHKTRFRSIQNWLRAYAGQPVGACLQARPAGRTRAQPGPRLHLFARWQLSLPGRSLMLVRNVGHLMTNDAILDQAGHEIPEGIMDAMLTALIAMHDLRGNSRFRNSRSGSVHRQAEDARAGGGRLHEHPVRRVEMSWPGAQYPGKSGIMDEERRTTVNLMECIRAASERVIFINTGFLDRTGDEIHTSMELGPVPAQGRDQDPALDCRVRRLERRCRPLPAGLAGRAQIGKGMWAIPDQMAKHVADQDRPPTGGGELCLVPSPTAATLHAMHYHDIDVTQRQSELKSRPRASLDDILTPPLMRDPRNCRRQRSSANWTTTRRASPRLRGCAGSIRRRLFEGCRISTTSA